MQYEPALERDPLSKARRKGSQRDFHLRVIEKEPSRKEPFRKKPGITRGEKAACKTTAPKRNTPHLEITRREEPACETTAPKRSTALLAVAFHERRNFSL